MFISNFLSKSRIIKVGLSSSANYPLTMRGKNKVLAKNTDTKSKNLIVLIFEALLPEEDN